VTTRRTPAGGDDERLLITLPRSSYERLEQVAARDLRLPDQQASYLLRRMLARVGATRTLSDDIERREAARA